MLILPIKRKWFDMILSGEKKEEYRDIKPYYDTRLMDASGIIQLMAAVHFVPGFEIHGKLTYIILALLMAVFSIEEKKEA